MWELTFAMKREGPGEEDAGAAVVAQVYFPQSVYNVVFEKSTLPQLRQLILDYHEYEK